MPKYRVFVRGANFLITIDDQDQKVGFYTTRFVEATDEKEAEAAAIDLLRADPKLLKGVRNSRNDPPMMYVEEIEELESFDSCPSPGGGFAFYPDGEQGS